MRILFDRRPFPIRALGAVLTLGAALAVAACDSPVDPDPAHGEPVGVEVFDRDTGERIAWTHGTGADIHWDGGLPTLLAGESIELDVVFLDADGNTIPLGDEHELRAFLAEGAAEGIIEIDNHGDHLDIDAVSAGQTEIYFALYHGNHSDWDSPSLEVEVAEQP